MLILIHFQFSVFARSGHDRFVKFGKRGFQHGRTNL